MLMILGFSIIDLSASTQWDKSLVRHLFDIHCLCRQHPEVSRNTELIGSLFTRAIKKDAGDFRNQHPAFEVNPFGEIRAAMIFTAGSVDLRNQYNRFVADMVYADKHSVPAFDDAVGTLRGLIESAFDNMPAILPS